ncbi:hypothetical protein AUEXF2481DRAFT_44850 [Aureobasidium subglaciale EXF-2481]|uniref:Uncharacterized protein n=1 Tax=Aureobasidium subglaciale (strain EXF-2481) TaxID=1043005 RepID=A0A074XYZ4_AURSE|nr:uncharacterized protein AUEXF2481DRAFT_44850 [Aureobasidium subglaciale EXF-2481]KAI5201558.1 hypothetical protein E4T38_06099 [Aureobasidium subglaciale]KAI5220123.1 hypothetical protein E4T40_06120 [Aureobasidium subglaciale]KAI5223975.1 hypothetical protein E4T41_05960 [Aureobasidium subglaciale]KAI5260657.1 hypothetical protein E4T46_05854 [Aureobasidium subglaciale]KEQ90650.1 hypothetical protein AUEXF2481DRAFT_44850 [Aureobasidium subglaciale EXF-2481]
MCLSPVCRSDHLSGCMDEIRCVSNNAAMHLSCIPRTNAHASKSTAMLEFVIYKHKTILAIQLPVLDLTSSIRVWASTHDCDSARVREAGCLPLQYPCFDRKHIPSYLFPREFCHLEVYLTMPWVYMLERLMRRWWLETEFQSVVIVSAERGTTMNTRDVQIGHT